MDFSLTEAQTELTALTRRIVTDQATPERLREVEAKGDRFDRQLWAALDTAGLLDPSLSLLEQCSVAIEIGRAVAPVPYVPAVLMGSAVLHKYGQPSESGAVVTVAHTAATAQDGALFGTLPTVAAAPYADQIIVAAGGRLYAVSPQDAGVTIERQRIVDGDNEGLVTLDNVRANLVTDDPSAVDWLRQRGTIGLCAHQVGVTQRALELTAAYATERVQFGRPIGTFQAVAQRLADAYIDVQAIELTMWQAAWRFSEGLPCASEVSTAKFWAADGGHRVAHAAVHVHGGVGIDIDHPLHRYFVAAKRNEFTHGNATSHLLTIGAALASS